MTNASAEADNRNTAEFERCATNDDDRDEPDFQWHPELPKGVCATAEGLALMMLGVAVPLFLIVCGAAINFEGLWRLTLLRPLETLIETSLALSIPMGNYLTWSALSTKDSKHPIRNGLLNGVSLGVSTAVLLTSAAALVLAYPLVGSNGVDSGLGFSFLAGGSAISSIVSLCLAEKSRRSKETVMARIRTLSYVVAGLVLSLLLIVGAEARSTLIRCAETMAVSDDPKEQTRGLSLLRGLTPEKDIRMNCADERTAGVAGIFLKLPKGAQQQLYFAATGKPFRDRNNTNMALMSNDYLRRHVVGSPIDGLTLVRSAIYGDVHADTLSAAMDWTFVFKNKGYQTREARAEIALPDGAVLSGLTLWINGEPQKALFGTNERVPGFRQSVDVSNQGPALLTDLGRGRYLLQCSSVPAQGELKVAVKVTEPLKIDGETDLSLALPRFIDNNFALAGDHTLRLRSSHGVRLALNGTNSSTTTDGEALLSARLKDDDLTGASFAVRVHNEHRHSAVAVADPAKPGAFIIQQIKEKQATPPRRLVVVIDGSKAVGAHVEGLKRALASLPAEIDTRILISDEGEQKLFSREDGLKRLSSVPFDGGRDNLESLVKAAEFAGESKGGAVLWVHGPQPGFNEEMYIMAPYAAPPKFFELALDDCWTDANELFRNHREIGPFNAIVRNANVQDDLAHFFQRWKPGAKEQTVELARKDTNADCPVISGPQAEDLIVLKAFNDCANLYKQGKSAEAARIAVANQVVTPATVAVIMNNQTKHGPEIALQTTSGEALQQAPSLKGGTNETLAMQGAATRYPSATNGPIGPQGADATVIVGVNTAGSIRVNNLANLEALCNILANAGELIGIALGAFNIIFGALGRPSRLFKITPLKRMLLGCCAILVGLAIPGSINWFIASARDANLFE